ncbi:MAG: phenylalanine--tRNA ligase subunit alpha [bacterium]|nr:phenylalanine--tRNA ligase subunit alpha [bacterium]
MLDELKKIKKDALESLKKIKDKTGLTEWENKILGRKSGVLTEVMKDLKNLSDEARKEMGKFVNEVKSEIEKAFKEKSDAVNNAEWAISLEKERVDVTQPALPPKERGHLHPITIIQRDLEDFFTSMGFMVLDGPELESEYYNFTAVNIPATHPARDMQDTFYIKGHGMNTETPWVMRTHTSNMQVRSLQKFGAPLRMIVPGKCFRNEATDVRHEHTLYQLEGVVVDKNITFGHMKGILEAVAKHLYGEDTKVRLRPKFYPFVEPGVNGEVSCFLCKGDGCRLCKQTGWLEIFGAGMVHPNVLKEGNVDSNIYQGFAFGFGLMRLVMLKYGIEDIRLFESGDLRFLQQF